MKDEPPQHLYPQDPNSPSGTVIHHPVEDETLLARWLYNAMEKGPRFWGLVGALVVGIVLVGVMASGLTSGSSSAAQAWTDLALARNGEQQEKVAETYPKTPAARWAQLAAAGFTYNRGFEQLTTSRDAALPLLKRAQKKYKEVYDEARETDPELARLAAFGMARCLESLGDLPAAIAQYRLVAKQWPESAEGKQSTRLASALEDPKNAEFYTWLASYKPPEMTLPPMGTGTMDLPSMFGTPGNLPGAPGSGLGIGSGGASPFDLPPLGKGILDAPASTLPAGSSSTPPTEPAPATVPPVPTDPLPTPPAESTPAPATGLPGDPFAPQPPASAPSPEASSSGSGLPADPFAPAAAPKPEGEGA